MADGSIQNLFQMDSPVGSVAMAKARPENIRQLAEINSIIPPNVCHRPPLEYLQYGILP